MDHDYYHILGVDPTASLETIKKAYRRRAAECHPDRGGSHEQMVLLNEAWTILSNPESRSHYDNARKNIHDDTIRAAAEADVQSARRSAEDYPPEWEDMKGWLDAIAADFERTTYGQWAAHGSSSGWIFTIGGFAAGVVLWMLLQEFSPDVKDKPFLRVGLPMAGAAAGATIHRWMRNGIRLLNAGNLHDSHVTSSSMMIIRCVKCGQSLRVPGTKKELLVTCGKCGHKFSWVQS